MGAQAVRLSNTDIDKALDNRDFELLFQPIFDLHSGAIYRVEAFVRWRHRTLGLLPPGAFISFLEAQGRMSELTRYLIDEALETYIDWRGTSGPGLSINLALSDLADETFGQHLNVILRDKSFPADLITFECPMPPVDQPIDLATRYFNRLAETGARLAIEVRGRANDFLRRVDPFPFHEVKTGGAAILRFARTVRGPGLSAISELLELAGEAEAATTAVGVEDQASLSALRSLGFAAAQGNHLAKVGDLSSFSAEQINDVRTLLGLESLRPAALTALFGIKNSAAGEFPENDLQESNTAATTGAATTNADTASSNQADNGQADNGQVQTPSTRTQDQQTNSLTDPDLIERLSERIAEQQGGALRPPKELSSALVAEEERKMAAMSKLKERSASQNPKPNIEPGSSEAMDNDENLARALQSRLSEAFDQPGLSHGTTAESADSAGESFIQAYDEAVLENELFVDAPGRKNNKISHEDNSALLDNEHQGETIPGVSGREEHKSRENDVTDPTVQANETEAQEDANTEIKQSSQTDSASEREENKPSSQTLLNTEEALSTPAAQELDTIQVRMRIENAHGYILPIYNVEFTPRPYDLDDDLTVQLDDDIIIEDPASIEISDETAALLPDLLELENDPSPGDFEPALNDHQDEPSDNFMDADGFDEASAVKELDEEEKAFAAIFEEAQPAEEPLSAPPLRRPRRKKNFLTRKYRIWPDHFWPKSWKRAWRRRAAHKAALRAERTED